MKDLAIHLCLLHTGLCQQFAPLSLGNFHLPCILSSKLPPAFWWLELPSQLHMYVHLDTQHGTELTHPPHLNLRPSPGSA